jgi:hypothetical protein
MNNSKIKVQLSAYDDKGKLITGSETTFFIMSYSESEAKRIVQTLWFTFWEKIVMMGLREE